MDISADAMRAAGCLLFLTIGYSMAASCSSDEYCPAGWSILRRRDQTPYTCDPMKYDTKCPKPHSCVHSKCGLSFCCANPDQLRLWKRQQEILEEMKDDENEEL